MHEYEVGSSDSELVSPSFDNVSTSLIILRLLSECEASLIQVLDNLRMELKNGR